MVAARGWGRKEIGSYCLIGIEFQFCKMKRVLKMDSGDGCTTIWMYLIPLNWTLKNGQGASLVAQWLRICLPMQGTRVRALGQEDPTCRRATKPMHHNYWACALELASHNYWSPHATTTEAHVPRAHAPQQEKPLQWEACAPQRGVAPTHRN